MHPSPGLPLFVRPVHLIAAPHSLCPAGASHRRATISSFAGAFAADPPIWCCFFCRRICCQSTNLVLLRLPAHSPPIHRFGVASFAGAFTADPPIWCCFVCRRIRRRSTNLVLLRLPAHSPPIHRFGVASFAGAFLAEPPPIWRCFTWPAHSSPSRHQLSVVSLGRRIPRRFGHFVCRRIRRQPTDLVSLFLAGASPRRATIALFGRRIPSPCHHCLTRLAHPIAMPPSPISVGASHRRTALSYFSRCISSPHLHRLSLGLRAHSMPHCKRKYQSRDILHASASAASILM